MTEEDEAFKELEDRLKPRATHDDDTQVYRNELIEEIASIIEHKFTFPFGHDTVSSFANFIRQMKR